jgi:hypothetical protein
MEVLSPWGFLIAVHFFTLSRIELLYTLHTFWPGSYIYASVSAGLPQS